jgi:hypothetical protein
MLREELRYWAALAAAACGALIGVGVVSPPYDKWVVALSAVAGAVSALNISPPKTGGTP